jgi:hypothetical protein
MNAPLLTPTQIRCGNGDYCWTFPTTILHGLAVASVAVIEQRPKYTQNILKLEGLTMKRSKERERFVDGEEQTQQAA